MHFLKTFITMLLVSLLILLGAYVIWIPGRIIVASWFYGRSVTRIINLARNPAEKHIDECYKEMLKSNTPLKNGMTKNDLLTSYFIKFKSNTEYELGYRCQELRDGTSPEIMFDQTGVMLNVAKFKGVGSEVNVTSDNTQDSFVLLGGENYVTKVGVKNGILSASYFPSTSVETDLGEGQPLAACSDWGYTCCEGSVAEVEGASTTKVSDCPTSCASSCKMRPSLLFFNSEPALVGSDRSIQIYKENQSVTFGYEVVSLNKEEMVVTIDYGDGIMDEFPIKKHVFEHTFNCQAQACEYEVNLSAVSKTGTAMAISSLQKILVKVN